MSEVWQLARADIGLRCWEDGCIAYQPLTGETHMLTPQAGHILDVLQADARTTAELMAVLDGEADMPELAEVLDAWLTRLFEARLISRRPS